MSDLLNSLLALLRNVKKDYDPFLLGIMGIDEESVFVEIMVEDEGEITTYTRTYLSVDTETDTITLRNHNTFDVSEAPNDVLLTILGVQRVAYEEKSFCHVVFDEFSEDQDECNVTCHTMVYFPLSVLNPDDEAPRFLMETILQLYLVSYQLTCNTLLQHFSSDRVVTETVHHIN